MYRWLVIITYATDNGPLAVDHQLEELHELHSIVELGPDWNAIEDIRITYNRRRPNVTIENARDND